MNEKQLKAKLRLLLSLEAENEIVEFKEAKSQFDFDKLGKYFSALSNEANIRNKDHAWLVLGVNNKQQIVGSNYCSSRHAINKLKHAIAEFSNCRNTFFEIHVLDLPEGRVVMFQISPALKGIPVSFKGHYYGREGESLTALSIQKIEFIRKQTAYADWSSAIVPQATLDDLDPDAIKKAKAEYKAKHRHQKDDVEKWPILTFLNKAKLTVQNKITRTALLLLGKESSLYLLDPAVAQISWILKDNRNQERDYAHFSMPDYDLTKAQAVKVKIFGTVLNKNYTQLLMEKGDLDLHTVILLDKLQKCKTLLAHETKLLKSQKLIEGRKPNYYVAASIASLAGEKAQYIKNKGFKDSHYKQLIIDYIHKFGPASRQDIDGLLLDSLPRVLTDKQKKTKITNLLYTLSKKEGIIKNASKSNRYPSWVLKNKA